MGSIDKHLEIGKPDPQAEHSVYPQRTSTWYEVFVADTDGSTFTLSVCSTLAEAISDRQQYIDNGSYTKEQLGIDKWQMIKHKIIYLGID